MPSSIMSYLSDSCLYFQNNLKKRHKFMFPVMLRKKPRRNTRKKATLHIKTLGPSRSNCQFCESISLEPYKPYTIGRKRKFCDFIIADRRVSKRHFQLLFDSVNNKIYISDGVFIGYRGCSNSSTRNRTRCSLNGVFVNGNRVGAFVELSAGDVVWIVCGKRDESCCFEARIGFLVERVVFMEEVDSKSSIELDSCIVDPKNAYFRLDNCNFRLDHCRAMDNTNTLLSWCNDILCSTDPVSCIRKCVVLDQNKMIDFAFINGCRKSFRSFSNYGFEFGLNDRLQIECGNQKRVFSRDVETVEKCDDMCKETIRVLSEGNTECKCYNYVDNANADNRRQTDSGAVHLEHGMFVCDSSTGLSPGKKDYTEVFDNNDYCGCISPPGKKFCLNRLQLNQDREALEGVVSLPELFHPVKSLIRVFIATFTSDILWFVSYCKIPSHLPVTIACHNTERCWSLDPDDRTSIPFSDFPNVTVVYPPFPEVIAFNKDRKNSGIACHHPKLIVLQREDSMRVVITSANLVEKQWHNVTNTVWWQDFPRLIVPDFSSLFIQLSFGNIDSKNDFAAQLGGFMASLVADVPSQAHWIMELIKYNFNGALGYLVTSVPGIYSHKSPLVYRSKHHLVGNGNKLESSDAKLLASVEVSVVGLSHIYHVSADSNGAQLRKLASVLRNCDENLDGMSEIVLKRDTNIPADWNAVSVFIPTPEGSSFPDFVQLGFLPRHIAKWVAPLSDVGIFAFSAYINPKEVLATALEGSANKVKLILYVYAGPTFYNISDNNTLLEYAAPICTLIASSQRYAGLWRLKEVLGQYKWSEHLESEFVFGSSSVGAVNAQFLAAFSAAAGKHSESFSESEESDPNWGCWDANLEIRNPSVSIIFPTIERLKSSNRSAIMASKRMLCFSQKTWQRLKNVGILHDAIPCPIGRVGFPMHVKVGRRRFQSTNSGSSFGWVYSGSHNFSAAAWGRPVSNRQFNGTVGNNSILGSKLHIANYELGIVFIVPPPDMVDCMKQSVENLDDITLPFVMPPPKYTTTDRPATAQAMRDALNELMEREREWNEAVSYATDEWVGEEIPEEEEVEVTEIVKNDTVEKEDEKAYADRLWSQVHSSQSC